MPIGNTVQRGAFVYVYDEKGRQTGAIPTGSGKVNGLKGYTSTRVSVRRGAFIYLHDEKRRGMETIPSGQVRHSARPYGRDSPYTTAQ